MALEIKDILLDQDGSTDFLRVSCVARRLGLSTKRIYQLIQMRQLVAIKFGPRQTRVMRESVEDYIRLLLADDRENTAETDS